MNKEQALVAFEQHSIRRFSDAADETWDFPVIAVVVAGKTGGGGGRESPSGTWKIRPGQTW
jgi:hypothetical protein